VSVTAIARPGYKFVKWTPGNNPNPTLQLGLQNNTTLTAVFDIDPGTTSYSSPVINEVMASNFSTIADEYGQFDDWMEIYNPGSDTIDVGGMYITDHLVVPTRFHISTGNDSTKIAPHSYKLFWLDDDTAQGVLHTNFKLSTQFSMLALVDADGESIVDSVRFTNSLTDVSYGRRSDGSAHWISFPQSTPDATNWMNAGMVFINELAANNQSVVSDEFGEYDQWLELYNPNSDTVDVAAWRISDGQFGNYLIPSGNDKSLIPPFGFKIFWADQQTNQGWNHMDFSLNGSSGGCVYLVKPDASQDDQICYSFIPADSSYGRAGDGSPVWRLFKVPTPDASNIDLSIGLNEIAHSGNLEIFPNPLIGTHLHFSKSVSFQLTDVMGRKLFEGKNCREIDVSALKSGA
jgi:hypothetical protein